MIMRDLAFLTAYNMSQSVSVRRKKSRTHLQLHVALTNTYKWWFSPNAQLVIKAPGDIKL